MQQFSNRNIKYVRLLRNRKAAGGRNAGIQRAKGEYLLFIDLDNVVDPLMIGEMVLVADRDASIGMIGPLMLYHKANDRVWFCGNDMNLITSKVSFYLS